jgi:hypothetical protein
MQFRTASYGRLLAASLILALLAPAAEGAPPAQQQVAKGERAQTGSPCLGSLQDAELQAEAALPDSPAPQQTQPPSPQSGTPADPQPVQDQQNNGSKPVGTAAAPYEKTLGVAASRPAGAVIAPAKQRRVRTIWISIAAVAGAGIAVGTVVGLSKASSSRP